jgi:aryl-alcohol dehydrogenase-like predicted oxidoreductase
LQRRSLGNTGITVSRVGLGTVKFGRNQGVNYPKPFDLPSDHDITALLEVASSLGINLLDTAPAYGNSEERLGKLLQGQRHDWVLCTKVGETFAEGKSQFDFSPAAICHSIERSLQRLHTDYVDIVLVHSNGDDELIIEQDQVFNTLAALKQAGKIRAYGMSTKTVTGGLQTLDQADIAMVTYHPDYTDEHAVIAYAKETNKSIFIKKALGSGHLKAATSLPFIFAEPGVTSVIVGTLNPLHLRENVAQVNEVSSS